MIPVGGPLRPITPADHRFVLDLNEEHVELLAPLDQDGLHTLLDHADVAAVIEDDTGPAGFVVTLASGTAYDSPNYRWFGERYPTFHYLDRVVLSERTRRSGLGTGTYDAIEEYAATSAPVLCLEVNLDPPNEPSLAFHRGRGYVEVGRAVAHDHLVSLMVKQLTGAAG